MGQVSRSRARKLGFSVMCAGIAIFWGAVFLLNRSVTQRQSPRGTFSVQGTVIFTPGDPGAIYAMDLPTRRVTKLRIEGMSDYRVIESLSGPNGGHLVINSLDGTYYLSLDKSGVFQARRVDADQACLSPDGRSIAYIDNLQRRGHVDTYDLCTLTVADGHKTVIVRGDVVSRQVTWNPSGADIVAIMDTPAEQVPWHENEAYNRGMAQWVATRVDLASRKRVPLAIGDPALYLSKDVLYVGQGRDADVFFTPGGMKVEWHDSGLFAPSPATPFAQPTPGIRLTWNFAEGSDEVAPSFGVKQDEGCEGQSAYAIRIGTPDGSQCETLARVYSPPTGVGGSGGFVVCFSSERLKLDWAAQSP